MKARDVMVTGLIYLLGLAVYAADPRPKEIPSNYKLSTIEPNYKIKENTNVPRIYEWATYSSDKILRSYRASLPETAQHRMAIMTMDSALILRPDSAEREEVKTFFKKRLESAAYEMENTKVKKGAVIWKIYLQGFIVRTSEATIAFNLTNGWFSDDDTKILMYRIINQSDVLLIANESNPDSWVKDEFLNQGKQVIAPKSIFIEDARIQRFKVKENQEYEISITNEKKIKSILYSGHSDYGENYIPIFVNDGLKFSFIGNQYSNADFEWIDNIKEKHDIDFLIIDSFLPDLNRLIKGFDPVLIFGGNDNDMSQNDINRRSYFLSYDRIRETGYPFSIMAWGDSFYYDKSKGYSNEEDLILTLNYEIDKDPRPILPEPTPLPKADPNLTTNWRSYSFNDYIERQRTCLYFAFDSLCRLIRPTVDEPIERKAGFVGVDTALYWQTPVDGKSWHNFFDARFDAMLFEMDNTKLKSGLLFWKMYDHGFIIRSPSVTIGYDLIIPNQIDSPTTRGAMENFVDRCDVLFISHWHGDHYQDWIIKRFKEQGKPIIEPHSLEPNGVTKHVVKLSRERQIEVVMYPGYQGETPNSVPIIFFQEGYNFCHTGDLSTYENNDPKFNSWRWIDNVKDSWNVNVLLINNWTPDLPRIVRGIDPDVTISGHEQEIGHALDQRKPFFVIYDRLRDSQYKHLVLMYGESFYYR